MSLFIGNYALIFVTSMTCLIDESNLVFSKYAIFFVHNIVARIALMHDFCIKIDYLTLFV